MIIDDNRLGVIFIQVKINKRHNNSVLHILFHHFANTFSGNGDHDVS